MNKFTSTYSKYRQRLITPVTIIFILINLINLYFILDVNATSNDECVWQEQFDENGKFIEINLVKFEGVTWNAGIRDGDRLLEINGNKIITPQQAQLIVNSIPKGSFAEYLVQRGEETFTAKVFMKYLVDFSSLAMNLFAFCWLAVGFLVIRAKSNGEAQILFFRIGLLCTLFALYGIFKSATGFVVQYISLFWVFVLTLSWFFAAFMLPSVILHFFMIFPGRFQLIDNHSFRKYLYRIPLIGYLTFILLFSLAVVFRFAGNWIFVLGISLVFWSIASLLWGLILLAINYYRLSTKKERNSIFIILLSLCLGFAVILYFAFVVGNITESLYNNPEFYAPIILICIIPISFAFSIFRYSLLDVSDVIKNAVIYFSATVSLALVYFCLIYFLGQGISSVLESEYQGIITGTIFIIFAIVFQSTKDKYQNLLTKKFYPEQFIYQTELIKFSREIVTVVGYENILNKIQETFVESLKIKNFGILIKNSKPDLFECKRATGLLENLKSFHISYEELNRKFKEKNNLKQFSNFEKNEFPLFLKEESEAELLDSIYTMIPLSSQNNVIGLILLGLKESGLRFTSKEIELLDALAGQASISLENAILYASEAEKLSIKRDLENAKKIQESLLPRVIPQFEGISISAKMIPALQVGGDYYDIIKIDENKFYSIIGDVSGKGLAAAFYMTQLQTMMRLICKSEMSPKEILISLNKIIAGSMEKNWFITLTVSYFDLDKKIIKYCRAGHTPLLVINKDKNQQYTPKGIGVGLDKGDIFNLLEEVTIPYSEGDKFIYFSDGVTEEMNEKNELYGIDRLSSLVSNNLSQDADNILKTILKDLDCFRDTKHQNDDITLVVISAD